MKQFLLTTRIGQAALNLRETLGLVAAIRRQPEALAWLSNDRIAMQLLTGICEPDRGFIDVGAHIGSVVAAVQCEVPNARIVAIEAVPEKAQALRRRFPGVQVHACAMGDEDGEVSFFHSLKLSGYSSLSKPTDVAEQNLQMLKVPIKRLDALETGDDIDVIKIDVEGAELRVLRGATSVLNRCRPLVMLESGTPEEAAHWEAAEAVYRFFQTHNYELVLPNRLAHEAPGLSLQAYLDGHWHPRCTTNYFAVPKERRKHYRDRARSLLRLSQV
jgi:FkbM family methyltransferase